MSARRAPLSAVPSMRGIEHCVATDAPCTRRQGPAAGPKTLRNTERRNKSAPPDRGSARNSECTNVACPR